MNESGEASERSYFASASFEKVTLISFIWEFGILELYGACVREVYRQVTTQQRGEGSTLQKNTPASFAALIAVGH